MAEQPPIPSRLHELAELLRKSPHLGPDAQAALADLMDELNAALDPAHVPDSAREHLAASASCLVEALHRPADAGALAAVRHRLEDAIARIEAEAPVATGVLSRLLDTLANLGI